MGLSAISPKGPNLFPTEFLPGWPILSRLKYRKLGQENSGSGQLCCFSCSVIISEVVTCCLKFIIPGDSGSRRVVASADAGNVKAGPASVAKLHCRHNTRPIVDKPIREVAIRLPRPLRLNRRQRSIRCVESVLHNSPAPIRLAHQKKPQRVNGCLLLKCQDHRAHRLLWSCHAS